jgi:hypothetical protein
MLTPRKKVMDQKMNRWFQQKYLALLLALGMLLIVYPLLRSAFSTRILLDVLITIVFLAAFLIIFSERHWRLLALALAVPTLIGAWSHYVLPGLPRLPLLVGFHLVAALLFGLTVVTILRAIHKEEGVSADAIYGALCGYVLVGLTFGHLYCVTESLNPGSFYGNEQFSTQLQREDRQYPTFVYFSLVTLTSVGYGDITPRIGFARSLAVVDAIIGQFYIAVLIGELIGKRVSQTISRRPAARPKADDHVSQA